MEKVLDQVLQSPFSDQPLINRVHGFILMFDKSDKKSFQSLVCLIETLHELQKQFKHQSDFQPSIIIIGNKSDLKQNSANRVLKQEEI